MDDPQEGPGIECEECGQGFPLRQGTGACPKCEKLKPHAINSTEYSEISQWPQCMMCGITRRNLPKPPEGSEQVCASQACKNAARKHSQPSIQATEGRAAPAASDENDRARSQAIAETDQIRAAQTRERLRLSHPPQRSSHISPLNTAMLFNFQHGGGQPNEEKITVCWQPRLSDKARSINGNLGSGTRNIARSVFLADLKAEIIQQINVGWVSSKSAPLIPDDASFRWHGNRLLEKGTATMTVGEFYDHHATPTLAPLYLRNVPPVWKVHAKSKNPLICLELYINCEAFENRTNGDHMDENVAPSITRTAGETSARKRLPSMTSEASIGKRPRNLSLGQATGTVVHGSRFTLSNRSGPSLVITRSKVELQCIECIIDEETGKTSFETFGERLTGVLRDHPFSCGTMKCAYDLLTDKKETLVLKRFFTLDETSDVGVAAGDADTIKKAASTWVPIEKNLSEVQAELSRLVMGNWFLKAFYKFARSKGIDVDKDLTFADAYLVQEVKEPSNASGVADIFYPEDGITWLAEKKRPTTMCRYSGTLTHQTTSRKDLRSMTIFAFVHHAYGHSNKTMVFADLQGTPAQVNGQDGLILFDPMTHTIERNSGVGDFGIEGINSFIRDHICTEICCRLGLDRDIPLQAHSHDIEDDNNTINENLEKEGIEEEDVQTAKKGA